MDDIITFMTNNMIMTSYDLEQWAQTALNKPWIGIDTEFLREKTYSPLLCLVQVSSDDQEVCIDPLAIEDLSPLEYVLNDDRITKILHSCRQDLEAFDTRFNLPLQQLFDTQIAAAFCGYGDQVSYAQLVEDICGVALPKLYTRADWSKRPLPLPQIQYAIEDVRYLNEMRLFLQQKLDGLGRSQWHWEECERTRHPDTYRVAPPLAWKRLKGAGGLHARYHECARQLAIFREQKAQDTNRPREWILPTAMLLGIAVRQPANMAQLGRVDGANMGVVRKSGEEILAIVEQYPERDDAKPLWLLNTAFSNEEKKRIKAVMSMIREASKRENIAQALLSNRDGVERFVRGETNLPLFQSWRKEIIGAQILARYGADS